MQAENDRSTDSTPEQENDDGKGIVKAIKQAPTGKSVPELAATIDSLLASAQLMLAPTSFHDNINIDVARAFVNEARRLASEIMARPVR